MQTDPYMPTPETSLGQTLHQLRRWVGQHLLAPGQAPAGDWALWHAACAGDETSASRLVQQLSPQAYGLAMQLLARREDAEDAVQEAFLRLWGSRPSDARGASLATFFNTIVINRCKTWLKQRRELATDHDTLTDIADAQHRLDSDAGAAMPGFDHRQLQAAMARLPARQRMALAMWAYADADTAEIARSLELEPNAAHQLLHRAKMALKRQLMEQPT